jgi:hypothetical protein
MGWDSRGNLGIDGSNRVLGGRRERGGIPGRAHHQHHGFARLLRGGKKDFRLGLRVEAELFYVSHNSDNLEHVPGLASASIANRVSNGLTRGPPPVGESLIDNGNVWRSCRVG